MPDVPNAVTSYGGFTASGYSFQFTSSKPTPEQPGTPELVYGYYATIDRLVPFAVRTWDEIPAEVKFSTDMWTVA